MRLDLGQIMKMIAATVNQEPTAPDSSSSEYGLWLEFVNRSIHEWDEANDWEEMRISWFPSSTASGMVILPTDFKKLAGTPLIHIGGNQVGSQYPHIIAEQKELQNTTDQYSVLSGNSQAGFVLTFNPATISSGASIEIPYYAHATSVSGASDVPALEDAQFLIDRTVGYIFEARSDSRFQTQEQKARDRLLTMIENSNLRKFNSYAGSNPVISTMQRQNFRVGRD